MQKTQAFIAGQSLDSAREITKTEIGIVTLTLMSENSQMEARYQRHRFPPEVIGHAVCLYHRFTLSFPRICWPNAGSSYPSVEHRTGQYENNRAEVSHQHTREKERQVRRFKSIAQAQRLLAVHGQVQNLFRVGRNHLKARHYRLLRKRAFVDSTEVICAY